MDMRCRTKNTAGYGSGRMAAKGLRQKAWNVLEGLIGGLFLLSSCADRSYPGEEVLTQKVEVTPESTYPVIISVGNSILDESTPEVAARKTPTRLFMPAFLHKA